MSEEPGSISSAPMSCFAIRARAFTRRAANSSLPIGFRSPVIDFNPAARSAARSAASTCPGRSAAATATPRPIVNTSRRRIGSTRLVGLVRFLFDDGRAELGIDALLDGGAIVVGDVDRARQLDEFLAETLCVLFVADLVLDHPQHLVDARE